MTMILLFIVAAGATLFLVLLLMAFFRSRRGGGDVDAADDITPEDEARTELLAELKAGYKGARDRGVKGGLYMCAASHCIQLLQAGCEIDEGAARMALRGLEGDEDVMMRVGSIIYPGERE